MFYSKYIKVCTINFSFTLYRFLYRDRMIMKILSYFFERTDEISKTCCSDISNQILNKNLIASLINLIKNSFYFYVTIFILEILR